MPIKIALLHGLESNNKGQKNDWLRTIGEVYDPLIDYRQKSIYNLIRNEISDFNPDILIGSSMGGFFSYEISKELNIPALLFNPALHSRSFTPDMTGKQIGTFKPEMLFVFGQMDELINPSVTIEILIAEGYTKNSFVCLPHGHRTPFEVFTREAENFLQRLPLRY